MTKIKRFQKQKLSQSDWEEMDKDAKLIRAGSVLGLPILLALIKKYSPKILKNILSKNIKL